MENLTLTSSEISCDHCRRSIEEALSAEAGVQSVAVDVDAKSITVEFDPNLTSRGVLAGRLDEEGYPVDA